MMISAVPLEAEPGTTSATIAESAEERLLAAMARLEAGGAAGDTTELGDHLALLRRWYYRPEKQRAGAVFFRERDAWPVRRMVRAAAKLAAPPPAAETPVPATSEAPQLEVTP